MNRLGSTLYDPGTAVSKSTAGLLAMTAFDTTNLRLAVTVPAHGCVFFRMQCVVTGSTTLPVVMLGVMVGASVKGRASPRIDIGNIVAGSSVTLSVEFTVSGLSAGATNFDAAYAVQVIASSTNIKYGGPDNNSGANAWGGFLFEAWDPQPLTLALDGGVNVTQFGSSAGTFSGGRPEVNATHIAGSAVNTSSAQIGVNVVSYASGQAPLQPTTAGRTLDVSAGGEAGLDWANVGSPMTTVSLSGTTVAAVSGAVGSVTGAVGSVTGAVGSVTGNVGGNVTGSVGSVTGGATAATQATHTTALAAINADTDDIQSRLPAALVSGRMDASVGAMAADVLTAAAVKADAATKIEAAVWAAIASGALTALDVIKLMGAVAAGKTTITPGGGGAATVVFRDLADTKDSVTATMAGSERTALTLNP